MQLVAKLRRHGRGHEIARLVVFLEAFIKVESQIGYDDRNKVAFYSPASSGGFTVAGASAGFNNDDVPF
jgi:hypothetical protein